MKRLVLMAVLSSTAVLAACGGTEVVVQAQIEGPDGAVVALRDLPVRALPYDRDAMFDSLRAEYGEEEPPIPEDLRVLQDSIARAQEEWRVAETRWGTGRDSLRTLRQQMDQLSPASGQYVALFNQFNALEGTVRSSEQQMNQAFQRFQNLQNRYTSRAQETRLARDQWADAAYADVDRLIAARLRELRREEAVDTTDGNGMARLRGMRSGEWWVHARYDLPFEELYWNIPINVERGEQTQIQLTRQTAEVRPKL
jgi:outer membrane murein-binding lipoprotein Lpp